METRVKTPLQTTDTEWTKTVRFVMQVALAQRRLANRDLKGPLLVQLYGPNSTRFDLFWICCTICRIAVRQIDKKLKKWSFGTNMVKPGIDIHEVIQASQT